MQKVSRIYVWRITWWNTLSIVVPHCFATRFTHHSTIPVYEYGARYPSAQTPTCVRSTTALLPQGWGGGAPELLALYSCDQTSTQKSNVVSITTHVTHNSHCTLVYAIICEEWHRTEHANPRHWDRSSINVFVYMSLIPLYEHGSVTSRGAGGTWFILCHWWDVKWWQSNVTRTAH